MKFDPDKAFEWLNSTEAELAKRKAAIRVWDEGRKIEKSRLMRLSQDVSQGAKEAYAYAHEDYKAYLNKMAEEEEKYELLKMQRETVFAQLDAWRTFQASERQMITKFK